MARARCKCGKAIYRNKIDALISLKRMKNIAMNAYTCERGKWHLGKTRDPLRCAWRIDQILAQHQREFTERIAASARQRLIEAGKWENEEEAETEVRQRSA